jgi:hypothetical protein
MPGAEKMFREGLAIAKDTGDRSEEALISNNLAGILYGYGNDAGAQAMYENAEAITGNGTKRRHRPGGQ